METDDHGSTLNLQKEAEGEDDEQTPSPISNVRSYECTFCKRGFSNAQALGGHMNIHRKHKAKLKQSSSSTSSSSPKDITSPHQHQQQLQPITSLETFYSPTTTPTTNPSWPWNVPQHDQDQTNPVESPTHKDGQTGQQLDLELRLGPQPNKDSTSTPTRKFF